jgi:hypothetical protein
MRESARAHLRGQDPFDNQSWLRELSLPAHWNLSWFDVFQHATRFRDMALVRKEMGCLGGPTGKGSGRVVRLQADQPVHDS